MALLRLHRCGTVQHCPSFLGNETNTGQTLNNICSLMIRKEANLDGSSSSVLESRVRYERGPGGFFPLLFFSNENTLRTVGKENPNTNTACTLIQAEREINNRMIRKGAKYRNIVSISYWTGNVSVLRAILSTVIVVLKNQN